MPTKKEIDECEWCPDDTCEKYWTLKVFGKQHKICNCCYTHLKGANK